MEAAGQDVEQEAADELARLQRQCAVTARPSKAVMRRDEMATRWV